MAFTAKLFINGESVDCTGESLAVQKPSTVSTIYEVVEAKAEQIEAAGRKILFSGKALVRFRRAA